MRDAFRAVALAPRRKRIGRRDCGEARKQFAHGAHVRWDVALLRAAKSVLDQGIHDDRRAHAVRVLVIAPAAFLFADQFRLAAGILVPDALDAGPLRPVLRAQRLAADDERRTHLAGARSARENQFTRYCGMFPPFHV